MSSEASSSSRTNVQRINNAAREAAIVTHALSSREEERPINTRKAYLSKQALFEQFCLDNGYENGSVVTEGKLLRFLDEVVVPRGNLKKPGRENGEVQQLSMETILQYIKAVVDLHALQASRNLVSEPSVRGKALKAWLKSRQYGERQRYRQSYQDRALHSAQDGYTPEELIKVSMFFFAEGKERSFRDRMVFLLQHMMLLRGETTRDMDLCDLFPLVFKDEGFSECPVLALRIDHGKTTKFGKIQYAGTIRHRNHRVCAFGALAMYFFYRWHISNEDFPNFTTNQDWFDLKVAKGVYRSKPMTYSAQLSATNRAFNACNISTSKKTHAGRGSGAQHAEVDGATEDQLRRHGRWNMQSMEACYLTGLPQKSIRIINGFPEEKGQFWIPRSNICPPENLQQKVFPQVEELLSQVKTGGVYEKSVCAEAFLQLLKNMRPILLQDAVLHRVDNRANPFFNHALFSDPEFLAFEDTLLAAYQVAQEPADLQLQRAMPIISQQLHNMNAKMDSNQAVLQRLLSERQGGQLMDSAFSGALNGLRQDMQLLRQACSLFSSREAPMPAANVEYDSEQSNEERYSLSRDIGSVEDLWREWSVGLQPDLPSVLELNMKYGASWRKDGKERQFYSRRLVLINEIERISRSSGCTMSEAAGMLEQQRAEKKWSLSRLSREVRQ